MSRLRKNFSGFGLVFFVKDFLVVAFLIAVRAFHISAKAHMWSKKDSFHCRHIGFFTVRAFIIAGIMFEFDTVADTSQENDCTNDEKYHFPALHIGKGKPCFALGEFLPAQCKNHQKVKYSTDNADNDFQMQKFFIIEFFLFL